MRPSESGFLILDWDLKETPTEGDRLVAETINARFSNNDCRFEVRDDKLVFHLKSLDIGVFRKVLRDCIARVRAEHPLHEDGFAAIVKKIEAVGSYGIKAKKRIYVGYGDERKVRGRKGKIARRNACFYAADNDFLKISNEMPKEFENAILCADSEDVLKKLPDNCTDLVVTSPPYNFGLGYDTGEDGVCWEEYFRKLFAVFDECIRVLKYGGRLVVNVQPLFSDHIPSHHIIANHLMQRKMIWNGEILWEKNNYNCKYTAWGSWKSPSSPYLKYTWEFIEVFSKGDLVKKGSNEDIDITSDEFKQWVIARWSVAPERNMRKYNHPAMFPEELVERVLKLFSFRNDMVIDPFNGVGTTTVVAKKTRRRYLGIDISKDYCKKAEIRLKEVL